MKRMPAPLTTLAEAHALEGRATVVPVDGDGGPVVWRLWGPADGAPTLLLHGGAGSWTHWVRNIDALVARGRRVIVPDIPGFGDSARPAGAQDADDLLPVLEAGLAQIVGARSLDAVGFSFGGLTATLWAAAHPARFAHIVLVGAPALSDERLPALPLRAWHGLGEAEARAAHRHNLRVLMLANESSIDELAVTIHGANVSRDRLRRRRLMLTDVVARTLPTLRCAVSGIWGGQDVLYRAGRMQLVHDVLGRAPGFRQVVVLPGAGHWVAYEAAAEFDAALAALL